MNKLEYNNLNWIKYSILNNTKTYNTQLSESVVTLSFTCVSLTLTTPICPCAGRLKFCDRARSLEEEILPIQLFKIKTIS